jgi:hypothetical protein
MRKRPKPSLLSGIVLLLEQPLHSGLYQPFDAPMHIDPPQRSLAVRQAATLGNLTARTRTFYQGKHNCIFARVTTGRMAQLSAADGICRCLADICILLDQD